MGGAPINTQPHPWALSAHKLNAPFQSNSVPSISMTNVHFAANECFHTQNNKTYGKEKNKIPAWMLIVTILNSPSLPSFLFLCTSVSLFFPSSLSLINLSCRNLSWGCRISLSGRVSGDFRVEGAGDGFLECTHLHSSLSLAEQREEVGEMRGRLLSLLWAAPARGERINCELWPCNFYNAQLLPIPCNIYIIH